MPNSPTRIFIEQFTDKVSQLEDVPEKKEEIEVEDPKVETDVQEPKEKESVKKAPDDLVKEEKATPDCPNLYRIMFYMKHFRPHDIIIKIVNRTLIIDAVHKEHTDEHGFVSRSVVRKQYLPDDIVAEELVSYFTADGVLIFQAPRIKKELVIAK